MHCKWRWLSGQCFLVISESRNWSLKRNFPCIIFKTSFPNVHREMMDSTFTDEQRGHACGWPCRRALHWESWPPTFKHQSSGIFRFSFLFPFPFHCTLPSVNCFYYSKLVSGADVAIHSLKEILSCKILTFSAKRSYISREVNSRRSLSSGNRKQGNVHLVCIS